MSDFVEIDGKQVDFADPCAMVSALEKVKVKIIIGGGVVRTRFDQDDVEFSPANLPRLEALIAEFQTKCARLTGQPRRRGARQVRWAKI